ncbi:MAG: DUF1467 family protein [Pseudomonadota bacterium]
MTITGAMVLFAVFWFMGMLIALPLGLRTHGDEGTDGADAPASAPVNANVKRKMLWVTLISAVLWVPVCLLIASGWITVADLDYWGRADP